MSDQELIDSEVKSLVNELRQAWPSSDVPYELYHYTDAKGLLGILTSKTLWATDINYLNDSMELKYGSELINEIVNQKIVASDENTKMFLQDSRLYIKLQSSNIDAYVTCFCENGNLLSQWRAYGARGAGYSIGLEAQAMKGTENEVPGIMANERRLRKIVYKRSLQEELVSETIDRFCALFVKVLARSGELTNSINALANHLCSELWQYLHFFKSPAFEEEQEWRVINTAMRNPPWEEDEIVKFRASKNNVVPFIEEDLERPTTGIFVRRYPITRITFGPTLHPELTQRSLLALLDSKLGYHNSVQVFGSGITLRADDI